MGPFISGILLASLLRTVAQQVPTSWRKPNITVSPADRVSLAEAAIQEAITFIDTTNGLFPDPENSYGGSGAFYSQLVEFDMATNQTQYESLVEQYFFLAAKNLGGLGATNFTGTLNYGHAAALALSAYKNSQYRVYADQVWWAVQPYTVAPSDVKAGFMTQKNITIISTCAGITVAGGTFRDKTPSDSLVNVLSTGGYLVLSALLAEATGEAIYLHAAEASANFLTNHLLNAKHIVQDGMYVSTTDSCQLAAEINQISYNTGLLIEGLAILYSISSNSSFFDLIQQLVTAAIGNSAWQENGNGIIANGVAKSSDGLLPRALITAMTRNAVAPALQSIIKAYLSVQYNAVVDLATTQGSNLYSSSWNGPPSTSFSPGNQSNAIQVLINSIGLNNHTAVIQTNHTTVSETSTSAMSASHKSSQIGPIVGSVVGGLILLLGILAGIFICMQTLQSPTPFIITPGAQSSNFNQVKTSAVEPIVPAAAIPLPPSKLGLVTQSSTRYDQGSSSAQHTGSAATASPPGASQSDLEGGWAADQLYSASDEPPEYHASPTIISR
ncbi:glycosyl hydrolase family 76-domain-containing protein [Favolaschia claudopus]|uniref:Glycosyl hydrolase family 76-domain-containing protein n=1 Tax=Favolaschia claudopus TaxID=2862362 RepID=A0AAW0BAH9_9AGAR